MDILSKSSDLLLQFDPPANAWPFLLALPIIGHTENNKRQDGNFQINFASFDLQHWPPTTYPTRKCNFQSFESQYSMEMLESLGYLFTDKYNSSPDIQNSFMRIEKNSTNEFHRFCTSIYKTLQNNHCLSLTDFIARNTRKPKETIHVDMTSIDDRYVRVRHITVTPMRMILHPLCREVGNRAVRQRGSKRYIRVYLREENDQVLEKLDSNIRTRFKLKMITEGIRCMHEVYYCVGSSTSQMKNFSYWFTTLNNGETVDQVRTQFGDFMKINNLATYAARIGLYFTTSVPIDISLTYIEPNEVVINIPATDASQSALSIKNLWSLTTWWKKPVTKLFTQKYVVYRIRDIKANGYCFTDGCGLISLGLAQEVATKIGLSIKQLNDIPSVFQIRIAGCKGILMIDPESTNDDYYIKIRDSMVKFQSNDWRLNICDYSRPMPLSLNNQVIRLLSDLGNKQAVFESLQYRMSKPILWHAPEETCMNVFDSEIIEEQQTRYLDVKENLLRNRIPLPIDEARNMFGVADVTGTLEYGQCFIQYQPKADNKKSYKVFKGTVLVTKNPCLYPGDIRKLQAVDVPILRNCMRDCIVFPTTGPRPHSDEISGSDLDGDQYWVYWGTDLQVIKPIEPLSHSSAEKLTVPAVTNEMLIEYYLDTIDRNCYSIIADVHTAVGDQTENGTLSEEGIELAKLFYRAIDSPKTGEIIDQTRVRQLMEKFCKKFPKFMMKFDKPNYQSSSILEILYLNAKKMFFKNKDNYPKYNLSPIHRLPIAAAQKIDPEQSQSNIFTKYIILLILRYWS